ncbi:MAG TPA: PPOX class F420-dependent oxidoreductase [Actinomycetospora sp.]|nr:PPOX class F420-dependent oxidoreductase [Actinomycetospora sp.]
MSTVQNPRLDEVEKTYLATQHLARLATVDPAGAPQNNPVGFVLEADSDRILIGGLALASTRKFRNACKHPGVALVIDDLASVDPWTVRGVEIRGTAEALVDVDPPVPGMSREVLRITPHWIANWGLDDGGAFTRRGPTHGHVEPSRPWAPVEDGERR